MEEIINLATSQKRLKVILNIIFVGGISCWIFQKAYFEFHVIPLDDINGIFFFFAQGHFFIPFAIFLGVWLITAWLRVLLFQIPNVVLSNTVGKHIVDLYVFINAHYKSDRIKELYQDLASKIKNSRPMDLYGKTLLVHRQQEYDYTLILRAFIAMIIYFQQLPYFGYTALLLAFSVLFYFWCSQVINYQLAYVTPQLIEKIKEIAESGHDIRSSITDKSPQ
ncbi:MAG TPA: hypothetical protein VGD65_24720 [Chryseosolibacter sp.]